MRKTTIAVMLAALTCSCKNSPTVNPKAISPDFTKAALKVLIMVRDEGDKDPQLKAAMIDAEVAAINANDKAAFALIKKFQDLRSLNITSFGIRVHARELPLIAKRLDSSYVGLEERASPATKLEDQSEKTCSDDIEKMLRSGVFVEIHSCEPQPGQRAEIEHFLEQSPLGRAALQAIHTP